jgi:hypothetical protein
MSINGTGSESFEIRSGNLGRRNQRSLFGHNSIAARSPAAQTTLFTKSSNNGP